MIRRPMTTLFAAILILTLAPAAWGQEVPPVPPDQGQSEPGGGSPGRPGGGGVYQEAQRTLVGGRAVESVPAGSRAVLELTLRNSTDGVVSGARASLTEAVSPGRIVDGTATIPTMQQNETAIVTFAVEIFEQPCEPFFGAAGDVTAGSSSWPFKVGFPVLCPGPHLFLSEVQFVGGDGDQSVEPGETLTVFVTLLNSGRDPATTVTATLKIAGDIDILSGSAAWPDIAPGASAKNLTPFVLKVHDDATVQKECPAAEIRPLPAEQAPTAVTPDAFTPVVDPETPVSSGAHDVPAPADDPMLIDRPGEPWQPGVAFAATFSVVAAGRTFQVEFSNHMVCSLEHERPALGAASSDAGARDEHAMLASAASAVPDGSLLFIVLVIALAGALTFRVILHSRRPLLH